MIMENKRDKIIEACKEIFNKKPQEEKDYKNFYDRESFRFNKIEA